MKNLTKIAESLCKRSLPSIQDTRPARKAHRPQIMYFENSHFRKLIIEVTNYCNFRCWFCPYNSMTRKKGQMSLENFKDIIHYLSELKKLSFISFGGWGEPTLHKDLLEMIAFAKSQNRYQVQITTNGHKFMDNNYCIDVLKTGIDKIIISLRITDKEKHKTNFPNNFDYQSYIDSILNLISLKYKNKFNTKIQISLFKHTYYSKYFLKKDVKSFINHEVIDKLFAGISKIIKKDIPSFKSMNRSFFMKMSNATILNLDDDLLLELDSLSHITSFSKKYDNLEKCLLAKHGSCLGLYNHFAIYWSGIVSTCCADFNAENNLGNIFKEKNILNILSNKKSIHFNDSLRKHKMPGHFCQVCRGGNTHLEKWGNFIGNLMFYNKFMLKRISSEDWAVRTDEKSDK